MPEELPMPLPMEFLVGVVAEEAVVVEEVVAEEVEVA